MMNIYGIVTFVFALGYMLYVKKTDDSSNVQLAGHQRYVVPFLCIINPVFSGAIFYYGWRNVFPKKAQTANHWSLGAFLVALIVYAGLQWTGNGSLLTKTQTMNPVVTQSALTKVENEGAGYLLDNDGFSDFCSEVPAIDPILSSGLNLSGRTAYEVLCVDSDESFAVSVSTDEFRYCVSGTREAYRETEVVEGAVIDEGTISCIIPTTENGGNDPEGSSLF